MKTDWKAWYAPYRKDLRLWLLVMLLLSLFRVSLIAVFRDRMAEASGFAEILQVLIYGMRFDCQVAGYVVALPVLTSLLIRFRVVAWLSSWIRVALGAVFFFAALWIFIASFNFFQEFDNQFNHFIFIGMQDDTDAILQTVWKEYHPIRSLLIFLAIFLLLTRPLRALSLPMPKREVDPQGFDPELAYREPTARLAMWKVVSVRLMMVVLVILSIRGSLGSRPAQRIDAAISKDVFLNKTVLNPIVALNYAFKDHERLNSTAGLGVFLPDHDLDAALKRLFPDAPVSDNLDDYFKTTASGPAATPPRHIFVLLMESYDSWPMLDEFASLQLTEGLKGLAADGLQLPAFLSSSPGTMASVAGVLTGLPDAGLQTDLQPQTRNAYPTAVADIFRRLGYRTRFFYGGKLGWRNIDQFAIAQGFDEVYGGSHMGSWQDANEWGVDDEYMFDFISASLTDEQPTFNFILSTTYHPPYDIDVSGKGYAVSEISADLADHYDGTISTQMWGHLWYADREMTKFIRETEQQMPHSLFAISGDHYARKFINATPNAFERTSVPLVLYGPQVLQGKSFPAMAAGSHIDIGPTLIELAAPIGFEYHAFGRDLLNPNQVRPGFGREFVIGPDYIAQLKPNFKLEAIPEVPLITQPPEAEVLQQLYNDAHGIAWWRIRNGADKTAKK
jgi:phosphoglycerol transferase MdoB-like AlkP superfamily enzyme